MQGKCPVFQLSNKSILNFEQQVILHALFLHVSLRHVAAGFQGVNKWLFNFLDIFVEFPELTQLFREDHRRLKADLNVG